MKTKDLNKTTEKEVNEIKKTVARLEKKILLMQTEIKKKQDKKITYTISMSGCMRALDSLLAPPQKN
jgi:ribosome-interacting GTPase 1